MDTILSPYLVTCSIIDPSVVPAILLFLTWTNPPTPTPTPSFQVTYPYPLLIPYRKNPWTSSTTLYLALVLSPYFSAPPDPFSVEDFRHHWWQWTCTGRLTPTGSNPWLSGRPQLCLTRPPSAWVLTPSDCAADITYKLVGGVQVEDAPPPDDLESGISRCPVRL